MKHPWLLLPVSPKEMRVCLGEDFPYTLYPSTEVTLGALFGILAGLHMFPEASVGVRSGTFCICPPPFLTILDKIELQIVGVLATSHRHDWLTTFFLQPQSWKHCSFLKS